MRSVLTCATVLLLVTAAAKPGTVQTVGGQFFQGDVRLGDGQTIEIREAHSTASVKLADVRHAFFGTRPTTRKALDPRDIFTHVKLTTECGVPLNQSANDALNGKTPVYSRSGSGVDWKPAGLTDARSTTQPDKDNGWFAGTATWDLGTSVPAENRQLDSVSIWIRADDPSRKDYAAALAVSADGANFTEIPGTRTEIEFRESPARTFNHVLYTFPAGRITRFRYIRLIAEIPPCGCDTRYIEVDAFVSRIAPDPAEVTTILTRHGSEIVCRSLKFRGAAAQIERSDGTKLAIPEGELAQIHFFRLGSETRTLLKRGRRGALLRNGDFLDGDLKSLDGSRLSLRSVLLGPRSFEAGREAVALALADLVAEPAELRIALADGSVISCNDVRSTGRVVLAKEPSLGELKLAVNEITEITRP